MDAKPIPAFYCCYLLRSTVQRAFNYIGSTPNMMRRIKQHNGENKGGAKRTSRKTLKPWEVTCIVHGFPSKIAALQFEWAWQHTHKSRHAKDDNEGLLGNLDFRVSPRSGKIRRKKPSAQARSLTDRITNLNILLRARSFGRWPLSVRFFAADVQRVFNAINEKMESNLARHVEMTLDKHAYDHYEKLVTTTIVAPNSDAIEQLSLHGVEKLDFGYTTMKEYVEKSKTILAGDNLSCAACTGPIRKNHDLLLVCEHTSCHGVTHMGCLSRHFTQSEPGGSRHLLPINGKCPKCKKPSRWQTLVKELSLRTRGEKELALIFKKPKARKNAAGAVSAVAEEETMTMEEQEESNEDGFVDLEEFEKSVLEDVSGQVEDDGFVDLNELEAKTKRY